jgi:SNF2 family DNA or RNA helicase
MPKADLYTHDSSTIIKIETTYQDRHLMTQLPGGRFNRQLNAWLAPLSWATCVTLRGLFGEHLQIGEDLQKWAWDTRNARIEPAYRIRNLLELPSEMTFSELDEVEKDSTLKLFPYQRVDVKFLQLNERSLLANEPGLGKTGVLIRYLQVLKLTGKQPFPCVVICPNSLKFAVWQRELAAWAPELNVVVIDGSAGKRRKQLALANEYRGGIKHLQHCVTQSDAQKHAKCASNATPSGMTKTSRRKSGGSVNASITNVGATTPIVSISDDESARLSTSSRSSGSHSMSMSSGSSTQSSPANSADEKPTLSTTVIAPVESVESSASGATQRSHVPRKIQSGSGESGCTCSDVVIVVNWDSVRLHSRLAPYGSISLSDAEREVKELNELNPRAVFMDEAHRLKSPKTAWTRAAWAVAHQARYRVAATGTPITDHVGDWWSLGHALEPTWFPAKSKFMDRYAQVSLNFFGGAEVVGVNPYTKDELFALMDPLTRRVPKKLALPQLPPKLPVQYRHTPMTTKQQKLYDQMREEMLAMLDGGLLTASDDRVKFARLMQFAAASAEIIEDGSVRLTTPSSKVDDVIDLLEEMGDAPLVVGAVSRQLIELVGKKLEQLKIPHGYVTGAYTPAERRLAVDAFQEGRTRVILVTLGAGSEGITLTRADTLLFLQEDFSEVNNQQFMDRIYRIGSERHAAIRIIKQVTPNSVEERKLELLEGKRVRMEEILRDETSIRYLLGG